MKATERLYLTADRKRVVKEDDPTANFLWKTPGKDISAADAKMYGLTETKEAVAEVVEAKAVDGPPENKAEPRTRRVG